MRKHEKELEEQLAAKVRELSEREASLQSLTLETAALKSKLEELEARIASYQEREGALVAAMTQAEKLSRERLAEAEAKTRTLLEDAHREADSLLSSVKEEAADTLSKAKAQAADTLSKAKAQAVNLLAQAETSASEHSANIQAFNERLFTVAEQAKSRLAELESWMRSARAASGGKEQLDEFRSFKDALLAPETKTPEEYANPAQLMRSIYAIERRELPNQKEEVGCASQSPEPAALSEEAAIRDSLIEELQREVPSTEENAPQEPEPRMWTVDEIVASVIDGDTPSSQSDSDAYLKQLIDDILQ